MYTKRTMCFVNMAMVPSILDGSKEVFGAPGLFRCGRQVQCVEERWQGMWLSGVSHKHDYYRHWPGGIYRKGRKTTK